MWMVLVLALAQDPRPPAVTTGDDTSSAIRLQLTGHFDLHYLNRSPEIDNAGSVLNGSGFADPGSRNFWSGRFSLRTDLEVKDLVRGVLELENRSFENGMNRPFATSPTQSQVDIKQGYLHVDDFLLSALGLRIGVQDVTFRNRPQDEPFFMDLGESEGFFRGFQAAGGFIANTVDRDITQPVGARLFYSPFPIMTLQAFWLVTLEGGGTPQDEAVYGIVANSLLGENWAAWLLFAAVSGGGGGLG